MVTPPLSPTEKSPTSTASTSQSAFIYPIKSAVSVKSPKAREGSTTTDNISSRGGSSKSASNDSRYSQRSTLTRNVFELKNPPPERVRSFGTATLEELSNDGELTRENQDDQPSMESELSSTKDSQLEDAGDMMRKLRIGDDDTDTTKRSRDVNKQPLEVATRRRHAGSIGSSNATSMANASLMAEQDRLESLTVPRFKHIETETGHMIVTGREGEITRCEDEPIHIPGAVQSFGCMIVVKENDDGCLVVRQVSENTGDVLGLPPAYLFRLESFLDCLEEDQADILWDNIESLENSQQELPESGPHIFQLSGYALNRPGKPREPWKCWCAAHTVVAQKKDPATGGKDESSPPLTMTVLEFELVNDSVNPTATKSRPTTPSGGEESTEAGSSGPTTPPPSITTIDSDGTTKISSALTTVGKVKGGLDGMPYVPTPEQFLESTQSSSRPIKALQKFKKEGSSKRQRPRRNNSSKKGADFTESVKGGLGDSGDMFDMFGILSQVNEQFSSQSELQGFLKVVVSIVRELTGFSRVMVYQFDEKWNGQVVCELVDWNDTHDLYRGLHFPATDIPKQARDLYMLNKIRLLYDRDQPSARMVCREKSDLDTPIDMTHSCLRAMSPIHIKYLANMGVRASMSISITAFDQLWGLIALHTYGSHGRRVTFPMRQLCRLIGESVSRNIERLSYTRRLSARKLINTLPTDQNPSGYIISNAEDLLTLFDADFGVIAIGNEAKILGPLSASQEVLAVTEYLRIKKFQQVITSQDVASDFPDMVLPSGLEVIAGLMLIPLSSSGIDFITFLRKAQTRHVNWAGKPFKSGAEGKAVLEPRKSFKVWSETVVGTCRAWKDEELETASVLCLVYGKFISVWRQREQAMQYNQLNKLLLSNATHEVRTPLNHIINYLEMALDSPLDADTRENLSKSHMASKSLLFVINDLLDLTRHEEGNKLFLQEPFDLSATVREAVEMHEWEAKRRKIHFTLETNPEKCFVVGDASRVRQIVVNTVSNSVKYTEQGQIHVEMRRRTEEEITAELPDGCDMEIELSVSDTGRGIAREKLEAIFREFEQVESVIAEPTSARRDDSASSVDSMTEGAILRQVQENQSNNPDGGIGLGLAIVARVVKNLGGQLRVDSTVGEGSRFTYYLPFRSSSAMQAAERTDSDSVKMGRTNSFESGGSANSSVKSEINSLVEAISAPHLDETRNTPTRRSFDKTGNRGPAAVASSVPRGPSTGHDRRLGNATAHIDGQRQVTDSAMPLRSVKVDPHELDGAGSPQRSVQGNQRERPNIKAHPSQNMSDKYASGSAGNRLAPPAEIDLPAADLSAVAQPSTSSSEGVVGATAADRRRARAKLISPGMSLPASVSSEKLAPLRVLVVEDDQVNRMILKKRLVLDGHTVALAVNGEDGFQQFEKNGDSFDVVLMDLQMPICNGQDSCRRIRDSEKKRLEMDKLADRPPSHILNGRIPIFAVSATLGQSMRQEMCDIGMDGWVLKPIDFNRLRTLLKGLTYLEAREQERWKPTSTWEKGGWLSDPAERPVAGEAQE